MQHAEDWANAEKVASVANLLFKSLRDKAAVFGKLGSIQCQSSYNLGSASRVFIAVLLPPLVVAWLLDRS